MPDDLEDQSRRGLLGRSLAGSRAPEFHARIDAAPYDLLEAADDVEARRLLLAPNHAALNVSPVYRGLARELCAHLSPRARAIGAVDTVLRESDGTLCGEHASSAALEFVLRRAGIRTAGRRVLIVTDPACASDESAPLLVPDLVALLKLFGADTIALRNWPRGTTFQPDAAALSCEILFSLVDPEAEFDAPLPWDEFPKLEALVDLCGAPIRPPFVLDAKRRGWKTASGFELRAAAAAASAEIFQGRSFLPAVTSSLIADLRRDWSNIVLIGMPGSGKTTIGKVLAHRLKRRFIDIDAWVEDEVGKPTHRIYREDGEAFFRGVESEMIRRASTLRGVVVATGGGSCIRADNRLRLAANGTLWWVQRPLEKLATADRPILQSQGATKLWAEREAFYRSAADRIVTAASIDAAVNQILGAD